MAYSKTPPEPHHRRSIRLKAADYSRTGLYSVTICAASKRSMFGKFESGKVVLNALGEIARRCWLEIPRHFPQVDLHEFVVMPNHMHGIVELGGGARYIVPLQEGLGSRRHVEDFGKPTFGSLPTIIRTYKAAVSREVRAKLGDRFGTVWQRNYYERMLRNGQEFADAARYILENPRNWEIDRENPQAAMKSKP